MESEFEYKHVYVIFTLLCDSCTLSLSLFLSSSSFTRARQAKDPTRGSTEMMTQSIVHPLPETFSTAASTPGPTDVYRAQVRLPNGRVTVNRHNSYYLCSVSMSSLTCTGRNKMTLHIYFFFLFLSLSLFIISLCNSK